MGQKNYNERESDRQAVAAGDSSRAGDSDVVRPLADFPVDPETLFDYLDLAVLMIDADGNLVLWNRGCERLAGESKEEAIEILEETGMLGPAWYHDGRRSMTLAEKVADAPERADTEYGVPRVEDVEFTLYGDQSTFTDESGVERHIEFTAAPIYHEGEFVGVIEVILTDLEDKLEKEQLRGLVDELMGAMAQVEDGNLDARAQPDETEFVDDDLLEVVGSFNQMVETLDEMASTIGTHAHELQEATEAVSASSDEISRAATTQVETLHELEDEVSQLSATVEEISATANDVDRQASEADELADEVYESAADARNRMDRVAGAATDMEESLRGLAEQLDEVSDIVKVIDDIAEQTNMLALNASIEAARAGESGDGFAVVADEVKQLAEESQDRATEIEGNISSLKREAGETIAGLEETTEELEDGIDVVSDASEDVAEIADVVSEVATGIQQVSNSTNEQAASTEQIAATIDEVVGKADRVKAEIDEIVDLNRAQVGQATEMMDAVSELADVSHQSERR